MLTITITIIIIIIIITLIITTTTPTTIMIIMTINTVKLFYMQIASSLSLRPLFNFSKGKQNLRDDVIALAWGTSNKDFDILSLDKGYTCKRHFPRINKQGYPGK